MQDMKKIILISVLIIETLLAITLGVRTLQKARECVALRLEVKGRQEELTSKDSKLKELELQLDESRKLRIDLENQLKDLAKTKEVLEGRMESMKGLADAISKQIDARNTEIFSQIQGLTKDNKGALNSFFGRMRGLIKTSVASQGQEAQYLSEDVTLPPIVVKKDRAASSRKEPLDPDIKIAGSILNVDDRYNLAIIDIGLEQNVKPGSRYAVLRGEEKIGEAVVREVYKGMSVIEGIPKLCEKRFEQNDKIFAI